ncbi:MAG: hypothetical protein HXY23_14995, partial [Parvularculaceae bacterium]|nr:hypothetical protein [Parvularculaceae bacterium]
DTFDYTVGDGNGGTAVATVTITLNGVNDVPTAANATVSTAEDTAYVFDPTDFGFADADAADTLQSVTIVSLPGQGTLRLSGIAVTAGQIISEANLAAGLLTFSPDAHENGAGYTSFTFRVSDGTVLSGGVNTLTIDVTPVNDEPSFTLAGNQAVNEDAGAQTVAGFATPSAGGGADEAGQTFSYTVSNDNNALFSVQPIIDASGNLTYTAAANAFGTATVTVFVTDSGGTAGGGDDTSPSQTFTITVGPVADTPAVTNATTNEDTQTTSGLVISRNAVDTAEVTHFKITGISNGTLYHNDGITPINDGDFITFAQGNAGLKFTPSPNSTAAGSFDVQASTGGNDGGLGGGIATATITVNPVNDAPVVTAGAVTAYTE